MSSHLINKFTGMSSFIWIVIISIRVKPWSGGLEKVSCDQQSLGVMAHGVVAHGVMV